MSPARVMLGDRARGRDNNFNLVRLCAAALVLVLFATLFNAPTRTAAPPDAAAVL